MPLISILLVVLVICIIIWAVRSLLEAFGIGNPIAAVVQVIVVLICLLYLLNRLGIHI